MLHFQIFTAVRYRWWGNVWAARIYEFHSLKRSLRDSFFNRTYPSWPVEAWYKMFCFYSLSPQGKALQTTRLSPIQILRTKMWLTVFVSNKSDIWLIHQAICWKTSWSPSPRSVFFYLFSSLEKLGLFQFKKSVIFSEMGSAVSSTRVARMRSAAISVWMRSDISKHVKWVFVSSALQ